MANGPVEEISLNPVSYVVLGFADQWAAEPTSYDLKQMVAGSVGYFWSFPHSRCTPSRPGSLPRATSTRRSKPAGDGAGSTGSPPRPAGTADLAGRPGGRRHRGPRPRPAEAVLRLGGVTGQTVTRLAEEQRAVHEQNLTGYDALHESICGTAGEWELATLDLGRRFEQMAIDFWADVARQAQGKRLRGERLR